VNSIRASTWPPQEGRQQHLQSALRSLRLRRHGREIKPIALEAMASRY
jgi:hypothetical protein